MRAALHRLVHTLAVVWAVVTILFLMFRLMPGNPMAAYINDNLPPEQQAQIMHQFGLDRSLWDQYLIYLGNLLRGDLGISFFHRLPVLDVLGTVIVNSLVLTVVAVLLAYGFGIAAGAWLAMRRGSLAEGIVVPLVLSLRAAPEFWIGMVLLASLGYGLGWFPSGGATSPGAEFPGELARLTSTDFLWHLILPVLTLAVYLQGLPLLLMRSTMLDVVDEEFITMARMKGLSRGRILYRHAARNALLPVVTAFALALGATLGGEVVIELVFAWPGIGRMLVTAVASSDYPLAQGAFLLLSLLLILMNVAADLVYGRLDPRIGHARVG